ncbi:conserved exported hypothetical protein [Burkholderia sp. 8Y]|uniref:lysozyme inhibitor LprI family protein n=1 Tax=Burkholderia sp. 8Y TaxID=2653133 RepID=UPI0012F1744A|nr:lysozyme inhibitor LprI family protein [Burkholderia sp. 8Y]VXC77712.1 conserved exported hypothetical protein [Burkholderia sp. 8Y]
MKKMLNAIFAIAMLMMMFGCSEQKKVEQPTLLQDISGVWKAQGSNGLMTIDYSSNRLRMLMDDTFIPVTVGAIDNENRTVNFNVTVAATGKPAVWTIRQLWNNDKTSFHIQLTLHDGTQDQFSFVRKISTDDLNHIASLDTPSKSGHAAQEAVAATVTPEPVQAPQPAVEAVPVVASAVPPAIEPVPPAVAPAPDEKAPAQAAATSFAPSFDCSKVSSGPERLVCDSPKLAALDVELAQSYKRQMELTDDKKQLKADQIEWRRKERDACSSASCMEEAYRSRIDDLDAVSGHLSKPAQFR